MQPYRYHVMMCEQRKGEGIPSCSARGSAKTIEAMRREIVAQGVADKVQITSCGSIGLCERGPNIVVYPDGVWYSGVQPGDVSEIVRSHFIGGKPVDRLMNHDEASVIAEIRTNRDRYLASMRARDAAGVLPDDLQAMIRAFQESRVALTALELDVFTAIGDGGSAGEVARKTATDTRATELLLNTLVGIGLIEKEGARFLNTTATRRFFVAGSPDDARMALLHFSGLWRRWSTLSDAVRSGTAVYDEPIESRGEEWTEAFIAAMHRNASERAPIVVNAIGAGGVARMIDIGGGSGAYSIAFAKSNAALRAEVFDLPSVLPITRRHIDAAGLGERVTTREGDLRHDRFGSAFDLVLLSAICHMLGEEENLDLLRRCRDAARDGGRVVIQDFILEPEKTAPKSAAMFSLNMLVGTDHGRSYSEEEYGAWLRECGFREVRRIRLPGPTGLMIATR